jgi:hypothetical protein
MSNMSVFAQPRAQLLALGTEEQRCYCCSMRAFPDRVGIDTLHWHPFVLYTVNAECPERVEYEGSSNQITSA